MTTFGDAVYQRGGTPVGITRLAELFNSNNIFFVDSDEGNDDNDGKKPTFAKALPSAAVTDAVKEAIIYIRPRTSLTNADVYYSDNIVIPIAKPHIQLIGAGAGTIPGYRGSAQIKPLVAGHIIEVRSSGVCIENLHLNGPAAGYNAVHAERTPAYPGCVALQMRFCRVIVPLITYAVHLGSNQYCLVEDNIFLGCFTSIIMDATYGSPQNFTIRRNTFAGLRTERDTDIMIRMTDINSRGHVISDNTFGDGLPNHASGSYTDFIHDVYATTSVATGMVVRNSFATLTADQCGTTGSNCTLAAGWFFGGNTYDGTSATGLSAFISKA